MNNYEREIQQLAGQNAALKADNKILKLKVERQRKTIAGYHNAIDSIHEAVIGVWHGE